MEARQASYKVLNGGTIELWKIEGLFYVKSTVNGLVKFSETVCRFVADNFIFNAANYGNLDFNE